MKICWTIWREQFVEKILRKHGLHSSEVEEALASGAYFRKAANGRVPGEDLYAAYGRTAAGRYVVVFFIFKRPDGALPISARDMTDAERRYYAKKRQKT